MSNKIGAVRCQGQGRAAKPRSEERDQGGRRFTASQGTSSRNEKKEEVVAREVSGGRKGWGVVKMEKKSGQSSPKKRQMHIGEKQLDLAKSRAGDVP